MELSLRARVRAGDPAAFAGLFDDHARAVYRYALRVAADPAGAEDVVSLTFLEAWRLRERVDPEPPARQEGDPDEGLRAWLYGIATNILRNTARSARRHRAAMDRLPPRGPVPDLADEVVDRAHHAQQLAAARAGLARLRRGDREAIALVVWSGLGYAEAAEALDLRVGTLKSRLSRARNRLRKYAAEELERTTGNREPPSPTGQLMDDRSAAIRPNNEQPGRAR
ncbi:RNA polymerase sigma factor [Embleya sp. NPDC005971]|uniref:RNA polymerase sigma factor n=1 Tax=Embleya sp. NPDC005971 TaxID=3156724 RepID=UPI0033EA6567